MAGWICSIIAVTTLLVYRLCEFMFVVAVCVVCVCVISCPVITIGGSYPGWLSAMMRLRYPAVVDAAYSASAPMKFYSHEVDQYEYYKVCALVGSQYTIMIRSHFNSNFNTLTWKLTWTHTLMNWCDDTLKQNKADLNPSFYKLYA